MNKGIVYAASAYFLWGFFPAFWKQLEMVPAAEVLGHRMVWSLLFLLATLGYRRQWKWISISLRDKKVLVRFFASACLLGVNWFTYIWGVNHGHIVETSLGYFINPLVNILLGVIFLREQVRAWQWVAIVVAAIGVCWLTLGYGSLPWIALILAFTFGFYALLRKTASLDALEGLSLEMGFWFLPALIYLLYLEQLGTQSFGHVDSSTTLLLAVAGVITAVPLLLFAAGARRIKMITLGILQYMAPTFQLLLGVLVYGEPFTVEELIGFSVIWLALIIYTAEGIIVFRRHNSDPVYVGG